MACCGSVTAPSEALPRSKLLESSFELRADSVHLDQSVSGAASVDHVPHNLFLVYYRNNSSYGTQTMAYYFRYALMTMYTRRIKNI
jgi:hypothetical protein